MNRRDFFHRASGIVLAAIAAAPIIKRLLPAPHGKVVSLDYVETGADLNHYLPVVDAPQQLSFGPWHYYEFACYPDGSVRRWLDGVEITDASPVFEIWPAPTRVESAWKLDSARIGHQLTSAL
jgi:hypothetical protein